MLPVRAYDGRNGILINQVLAGEDILVSGPVLIALCNGSLNRQGNLGIGDNQRKHECMRMATGLAENPCNPEQKNRIFLSKPAAITSIPDKAAGMAAGAGKCG